MLYKKASEMKPTPIPHCMGGEGTVMMERLLDAPAEMLGKGRAYVRHTLAPHSTVLFRPFRTAESVQKDLQASSFLIPSRRSEYKRVILYLL